MNETDYDVYVVREDEVNYQAVIDQTGRFDGLYDYIWPYNHGAVAGNHDARQLHGQAIQVKKELKLSSGQFFVCFQFEGQERWIPKVAIIPPLQGAEIQATSYMATVHKKTVDEPVYGKVPYTSKHAHIPVAYVNKNGIANHPVAITAIATLDDGEQFVNVIHNGASLWLSINLLETEGITLPLVRLEAHVANLKNLGHKMMPVTIQQPDGKTTTAIARISIQGNYTADFDRKNFEMELYTGYDMQQRQEIGFADWRPRSKFSLRGDYYDQTHARNAASYKIWREILASEKSYVDTIKDPEMLGTIQGKPVILYIDGRNCGIYMLQTYFDAASLNLDANDDDQILLMAVNGYTDQKDLAFASATPKLNRADFDLMTKQLPNSEKMRRDVDRLFSFIHNAPNSEFKKQADKFFDPLNLIDYQLFVGAINAYDNNTHNMMLWTYDGNLWQFSLMDLDISYNLDANGKLMTNSKPVLSNIESPLLKRIWANYKPEIEKRWAELRQGPLSERHIIDTYRKTMNQAGNVNLTLDQSIWKSPTGSTSSLANVTNFVHQNLPASDKIIDAL